MKLEAVMIHADRKGKKRKKLLMSHLPEWFITEIGTVHI